MATTITKTETLVGKRIRRREDPRLITGTATYVDDIKMPGMHHACIVRSPHAAAKIKGIDTQGRARSCPASSRSSPARTSQDSAPVPCGASLPGLRVPHHHLLAQDRVYFVGHPVAVVVATDRYIARDARRPGRSRLRSRCPPWPIPRRRSRRARRPCIPSGPTTSRSRSTRKAATSSRHSPKPKSSSSSASPASA